MAKITRKTRARSLAGVLAASLLLWAPLAWALSDSAAKTTGFDIGVVGKEFKGGIKQSGQLIETLLNIINALLVIAAIAAIVFIIISGVRYFTSQGDEDAVEQAKNGLIYGIIGVLVIILSIVLLTFFTSQIKS